MAFVDEPNERKLWRWIGRLAKEKLTGRGCYTYSANEVEWGGKGRARRGEGEGEESNRSETTDSRRVPFLRWTPFSGRLSAQQKRENKPEEGRRNDGSNPTKVKAKPVGVPEWAESDDVATVVPKKAVRRYIESSGQRRQRVWYN